MLNKIDYFLSSQSTVILSLIVCLLIALIGLIDHQIGYEISFSVFYLIPVCVAAWYSTSLVGYLICILSALVWFGVDNYSERSYSHFAIPIWNAGVRLGFYLIVAYFLIRLKLATKILESLAQIDGLTGLLNTRSFKEKIAVYFQLAARQNQSLTLAYLDLDGFKNINDTFGHNIGDKVLKAVAATINSRLRVTDITGRLGGDEFAILLSDSDLAGAKIFFESLHHNLLEMAAHNNWPLGFSFGVAVFHAYSEGSNEALRLADSLMYQIKKSGKNAIRFEEYKNTKFDD